MEYGGSPSYFSPQLNVAARRLNDFRTNTFRLETVSSSTAKPGSIITLNLPENSLIDMRSLRMFMKVTCTGATSGGVTVVGRIPEHSALLVSKVEAYVSGIQLNSGSSEQNTIFNLKRLGSVSRDKDGAFDRALQHAAIKKTETTDTANEVENLILSDWSTCFIGSCASRYIDTGLLGQISLRITFAPASVIVPKISGKIVGSEISTADEVAAAAGVSYSVDDIFFDLKTIHVDAAYQDMLRTRLASEGVLEFPYKEYYSFQLDGITTSSHTHRFSLATRCLDRLFAKFRDSGYSEVGKAANKLDVAVQGDTFVSNYVNFKSYDGNLTMRYQWFINSVPYPQYQSDIRAALSDLEHAYNKNQGGSQGGLITSLEGYNNGKFVLPLNLSMPGEPAQVSSGFDSRSINAMMSLRVTGQDVTGTISSFIMAETTALLKVSPGRVCAIEF